MSSTPKKRYDVFLSYRLGDVVWVKDLATRLAHEGLKVWFDEWKLIPVTGQVEGKKEFQEGVGIWRIPNNLGVIG